MTPPERVAGEARCALKRMARPAGDFDASRCFRGEGPLASYNVGVELLSIYRTMWPGVFTPTITT